MHFHSRLLVGLTTVLATVAIAAPAHAAERPRPVTITAAPSQGLPVALTDAEVTAAGLSLEDPTTITLPTGGTVVMTPIAAPDDQTEPTFKAKRRWFGIVVFFNKRETYRIGLGASFCAIVVGAVPTAGPILVAYCSVLSLYAAVLDHDHKCLRATIFWGSVAPLWGSHRGRYCR